MPESILRILPICGCEPNISDFELSALLVNSGRLQLAGNGQYCWEASFLSRGNLAKSIVSTASVSPFRAVFSVSQQEAVRLVNGAPQGRRSSVEGGSTSFWMEGFGFRSVDSDLDGAGLAWELNEPSAFSTTGR